MLTLDTKGNTVPVKDLLDSSKYELKWAVIPLKDPKKINSIELDEDNLTLTVLPHKKGNASDAMRMFKKRYEKNSVNEKNAKNEKSTNYQAEKACLAFVAVPKKGYETFDADKIYEGTGAQTIYDESYIKYVPIFSIIDSTFNIAVNPNYMGALTDANGFGERKSSHRLKNCEYNIVLEQLDR
jgi:hypothetical protein